MSCTKHFLNFTWDHHHWVPHVTGTISVPTEDTNMWGRRVTSQYVRCQKEDVCTVCGEVRRDRNCICDTAEGDSCAIRLECLARDHRPMP